jgi:hypothetical protein
MRHPALFPNSHSSIPSQEAIRWRWTHLLSFNPVPALEKVKCPVLGLFGELDNSSPVSLSVANMRGALAKGAMTTPH